MPLAKGRSKAAVKSNIKTLLHEGRPRDQAMAIAMQKAHKKKKMPKPMGN